MHKRDELKNELDGIFIQLKIAGGYRIEMLWSIIELLGLNLYEVHSIKKFHLY